MEPRQDGGVRGGAASPGIARPDDLRSVAAPLKPDLLVMAAGRSTRFGRLKQLEPVGPSGEALMDYAIRDAGRAGFGRIILIIRSDIESQVRRHMAGRWPDVPWEPVHQELAAPRPDRGAGTGPAGERPARRGSHGRTRPWGTAHAVLCAASVVRGPFAVINADDFYGADAFSAMGGFLTGLGDAVETPARFAVAGYPVGSTLSPHGGVSRAVLLTAADGSVARVIEVHELRRTAVGLTGRDASGDVQLQAEARVSMNLWGFTPAVFPLLRAGFEAFLEARADDPVAEFPISTAVNDMLLAGQARLVMLPAGDDWMGITHPGDLAAVRSRIAAYVAAGRYPGKSAARSADKRG